MKIELTVTGGFAGVGGKWTVDVPANPAEGKLSGDKIQTLLGLVDKCRSKGAFSKDFSTATEVNKGAARGIPDAQSYELDIDGQKIKWSEPAPAGSPEMPPAVNELKDWLRENAPRQPYSPT